MGLGTKMVVTYSDRWEVRTENMRWQSRAEEERKPLRRILSSNCSILALSLTRV